MNTIKILFLNGNFSILFGKNNHKICISVLFFTNGNERKRERK